MRWLLTKLLGYRRLTLEEHHEITLLRNSDTEQQWQIDSLMFQLSSLSQRIATLENY